MFVLRLMGYFWALPTCLWALFLGPFYGVDWKSIRWKDGALHITCKRALGMPGAQTFGWLMFFVGEDNRQREDHALGKHEGKHVRQALRWGILRDVAYGAEWLFRVVFMPGDVPAEYVTAEFWMARGFTEEQAKARVKKWGARWWRAYWNLYWERDARLFAGQRVR